MKRDIICLLDLEKEFFDQLLQESIVLKKRHKRKIPNTSLYGKTLGLLFEKASTRTRLSFETAMIQLGGTPTFIAAKDTQLSRNEPIKDTARAMSRYLDGLVIRTYSQERAEEFAEYCDMPVINGLTDMYHPCQIASDVMTVIENKGGYEGLKITWLGDANNVANSWINAAAVLGLDLTLGCPEGYTPRKSVMEAALARGNGKITVTNDPLAAIDGADVVTTDVWASMGQESEIEKRKAIFQPYQVNADMMKRAAPDAIILHCLPAHRGEEISEEMLEGPQSVIWDQAENKMHMHRAILEALMA